jgi:hypothetical protein
MTDEEKVIEMENIETTPDSEKTKSPLSSLSLELGDIISIIAPTNPEINDMSWLITYIDHTKILLVNISKLNTHQLNIGKDGMITDESITEIQLLSRSDEKGFARINHLLPNTWIDIHFGGEIPVTFTGQITNLEEDMIELTTYPDLDVLYIDFAYKGIPEDIPIEKIVIRQKPVSVKQNLNELTSTEEGEPESKTESASTTVTESGDYILNIPEDATHDEVFKEKIQEMYADAEEIVFGDFLEDITNIVEIPVHEQRYSIESQVNDLMDELLSTIPDSKRTVVVLGNIHLLIDRFKQLREHFSKFDENQSVYDFKKVGHTHKPMVERLHSLDANLKWILPVVSNRKRLYNLTTDIDLNDITNENVGVDFRSIETKQKEYYDKDAKSRSVNYSILNNEINNCMTPFREPVDTKNVLVSKQISTNLESIIDNLGDFYSNIATTTKGGTDVRKSRYVIQRYNLGMSKMAEKMMKNGKKMYYRSNMTANDTMTVKSLIMLPSPVMRFSTIDLPMTSILEKSNLHHHYFMLHKILNKKTDIISNIISDFNNEMDYEKIEKETKREFLSKIEEFVLSDELMEEEDRFMNFLNIIVPKTRLLIRVIQKYIHNKFSLVNVVQFLEPFLVYTNDISYKQYLEIRYFIKEKIKEIKKTIVDKGNKVSLLRNTKYNVEHKLNTVLHLLDENKTFSDSIFDTYKFLSKDKSNTKMSSSELLAKYIQIDNGNYYTNLLKSLLIPLMTPNNLTDLLAKPKIDEMTDVDKIKPKECIRRYLAKRYGSVKELQKDDNHDEVYYDKEFDDTVYDILNKYKDEQKKMTPEMFMEFLMENLIQKHDCPKSMAKEMAETLIAKRKLVRDGDYAMLEIMPSLPADTDEMKLSEKEKEEIENEKDLRKKIKYYRRLKNHWVHDDKIEEESFIDNNTLFCNISENCYKNTKNNICETINDTTARMKKISQEKLMGEFDKRYAITIEDLEQEFEKEIALNRKKLLKKQILNELQFNKASHLAYEIGKLTKPTELVVSPYRQIKEMILSQDDFTKQQHDILLFVDNFCREPMIDQLKESEHWLYCIDTNTPLLPVFKYSLAVCFVNGGDYAAKLHEICSQIGLEQGDSIVDKFTGEVIRKLDFSSEEGYDEAGFKITTHDIMEKDIGDLLTEAVTMSKQPEKVFENEITMMIYNVFKAICTNIDLPQLGIDSMEGFVLRTVTEIMNKAIKTEESYNEFVIKEKKRADVKMDPYGIYYNEMVIVIIASVILVAIQTAVPSFQINRTFSGCLRSFSGYPLGGVEDMTGLQYIACVTDKTKSPAKPWNAIEKLNAKKLEKRMQVIIDKYVINRIDIQELYTKKREYIILNPDSVSVEEHSITKWHHFMPPVVEYRITNSLKNISSDFQSELLRLLTDGKSNQHEYYNIVKSKAAQFGYAIIERINKVVKTKDLVLKTSTMVPFMENACCNENNTTNPMIYFIKEDENIKVDIVAAKKLRILITDVKALSKASMLYHRAFTGIKYPEVPIGHLEENIYAAFIHYCNFDRNLPIPENYKIICSEKPAGYNTLWTIQEKVEFLKKHGKRYTVDNLYQLMNLVQLKNHVTIKRNIEFHTINVLTDILENLDREDSLLMNEKMREHLHKVIEKYNPKTYVKEDTDALRDFKDYLYTTNDNLYQNIVKFFEKNGRFLERTEFKELKEFIGTIYSWQNSQKSAYDDYDSNELYSFCQYIKNAIFSMCSVYPSIILNDGIRNTVPKHWKLSPFDEDKLKSNIIEKYYEEIATFKGEPILVRLLQEVSKSLENINLFTQHIPIISPIQKEGAVFHSIFDNFTTVSLFIYCFYTVLYEYMSSSEDPDLLTANVNISKQRRRDTINNNLDEANSITGIDMNVPDEMSEANTELQEINIQTVQDFELRERVCKLLVAFLNVEKKNKSVINFSYTQIMKYVTKVKTSEKKSITDMFEKLDPENRRIEDMMKLFKIGRWNVGMQKGLIHYDAETNARETNQLMNFLNEDNGNKDVMFDMMRDVYDIDNIGTAEGEQMNVNDLETMEENENTQFYENEGYGIEGLDEDYTDGDYYGEDDRDDYM